MSVPSVAERQRQLHIVSESAAVLVVAPFLLGVAQNPYITKGQRQGLQAVALLTLAIDGWLLSRWLGN